MAGVSLTDMEARPRLTGPVGAVAPTTALVSGRRATELPRRPAVVGTVT